MKLSAWAKLQGVSYQTAWNIFKAGKLNGYKLPTGTIIIQEELGAKPMKVAVYARVSSSQNKSNLESQAQRLVSFCTAKGWIPSLVIKEIGSGLNDNRKKLGKILEDDSITHIVAEHKDRLSRFGMGYIEKLLNKQDRHLVIINPTTSDRDDLMQDFVSIITSFTARLYGQRRTKRRTEKLIQELENETN